MTSPEINSLLAIFTTKNPVEIGRRLNEYAKTDPTKKQLTGIRRAVKLGLAGSDETLGRWSLAARRVDDLIQNTVFDPSEPIDVAAMEKLQHHGNVASITLLFNGPTSRSSQRKWEIYRRAVQLAKGREPTSRQVRQAIQYFEGIGADQDPRTRKGRTNLARLEAVERLLNELLLKIDDLAVKKAMRAAISTLEAVRGEIGPTFGLHKPPKGKEPKVRLRN